MELSMIKANMTKLSNREKQMLNKSMIQIFYEKQLKGVK